MSTHSKISEIETIYVGGYTAEMNGNAVGIQTLGTSAATDAEVGLVEFDPVTLISPTYLLKHPTKPWMYATSESSPGLVSSLRIGESGALTLVASVQSGDDGGCHLCFDPTGRYVVVAHYTAGSIASFKINDDQTLSEHVDLLTFTGSGPDAERQDAAHAHQVVCDGELILVPDLGVDGIHQVQIDADGKLTLRNTVQLPAGSGPRHLVIVGDHLVVACELSAELWVSFRDGDSWSPGVSVPSSQRTVEDRIYPSAIVTDGKHIFMVNRGADTLAIFALDHQAHTVRPVSEISTGGQWPRDLVLSRDHAWVANQMDSIISVFDRSGDLQGPTVDFQIPSPSPACIVLSPAADTQ